jgi:hypothetical protein
MQQRRLCTLRLDMDDDYRRASLVHGLTALWEVQTFAGRPSWLFNSEMTLAYEYEFTGKRLPWISKYRYDRLPRNGVRFETVAAGSGDDRERFLAESLACTMFFRAGPSKYRKAYRNFLKDLCETGDWAEAQRMHLLSLDQDKLAADLRRFLDKRVRCVTPK